MKVVFVNYFHNGDLHVSRQFVRRIMETFPQHDYSYAHNCHPAVLCDMAGLKTIPRANIPRLDAGFGSILQNDTLYLNTWYGSHNGRFNSSTGIAFDALYALFDYNLKTYFNSSCNALEEDPSKLFPRINFSGIHKEGVDSFIARFRSQFKKIIMISNGESLSGQATNFGFAPVLQALAITYPEYCFVFTNKDSRIRGGVKNLKSSTNFIGNLPSDLNENGYLSTFCDLIVGRTSGAYTFAMIQDNMFESNRKMVSFSNIGTDDNTYWLGPRFRNIIKYKNKVLNYNIKTPNACLEIMHRVIKEL